MYKLYIEKDTSSEYLLKKVLKKEGIKDIEIIYNDYGKPYLKNKDLYFNISHSNKLTVLVISNKEVGVDVEKITMKERIIPRICTSSEQKLIKTPEDFTKMWVKKESYVKYLGIGIAYGLKNADTTKIKGFILKKYEDYYIAIYGDDLKKLKED